MLGNVLHHVEPVSDIWLRHEVHDHSHNELSNSIDGQLRIGNTHRPLFVEVGHIQDHNDELDHKCEQESELHLQDNFKRILDCGA